MHEAFAGVTEAHEQSLRELRARIAAAQGEALRQLDAPTGKASRTS